jgi:hypothetical protein
MLLRLLPLLKDQWGAREITLLCNESYATVLPLCQGFPVLCVDSNWRPASGDYDAHCSIMSLPYLMGLTSDSIPGTVPYIEVSNSRASTWRELLQALPGKRVGLVWAGSPVLQFDALRSIPLQMLTPLFEVSGISFVSLQKGEEAAEEVRSLRLPMVDLMEKCHDFMDTASLIDNLDLVISVDTAVAHLTGAIGKPVWLLNRFESEWRWLRDREDSVWYPTMRIFNQTAPRDWSPVIQRIAGELRALTAS